MGKPYENLGEALRFSRQMRGISRDDLAAATSISAASIAKYERAGHSDGQYPPIPKLAKIVAHLRADPRHILAAAAENEKDSEILAPLPGDDFEFHHELRDFFAEAVRKVDEISQVANSLRDSEVHLRKLDLVVREIRARAK